MLGKANVLGLEVTYNGDGSVTIRKDGEQINAPYIITDDSLMQTYSVLLVLKDVIQLKESYAVDTLEAIQHVLDTLPDTRDEFIEMWGDNGNSNFC